MPIVDDLAREIRRVAAIAEKMQRAIRFGRRELAHGDAESMRKAFYWLQEFGEPGENDAR